jgi:hypothetical protein
VGLSRAFLVADVDERKMAVRDRQPRFDIFPAKFAGRVIVVRLWGDRQFLTPKIRECEKDWMPRCIGVLDMRPERSEYNTSLPNDALWGLIAALPTGRLRYLLLYGYSLKRGQSLCQSIDFQQSVNLDDY